MRPRPLATQKRAGPSSSETGGICALVKAAPQMFGMMVVPCGERIWRGRGLRAPLSLRAVGGRGGQAHEGSGCGEGRGGGGAGCGSSEGWMCDSAVLLFLGERSRLRKSLADFLVHDESQSRGTCRREFFGPGARMCCVLTSIAAGIFAAKQAIMPVQNMLVQKKCLAWRAEVMGEARRRPRGAPNQMMHRGEDVGDRSQRSKH